MLIRSVLKSAGKRVCVMAAGSVAVVTAGAALTLFAEQPVAASERLNVYTLTEVGFEQAFEHYELSIAEAKPSLADAELAKARFNSAPVEELEMIGSGIASFYGKELSGRRTASGEKFDHTELTAAHRTLPFGSKVKVTNKNNGRSVVVRINDRGPFHGNRLIDLSREAAERIDIVRAGSGRVELALQSS